MAQVPAAKFLMAGVLVLAVPGGCIREAPILGHFELHNRTDGALVLRAEFAAEETLVVGPCASLTRDDFPLNSVDVAPAGRDGQAEGGGFQWGVDDPPLILVVTSEGPERVSSVPEPLPRCEGRLP
jgi:hypothetical protein